MHEPLHRPRQDMVDRPSRLSTSQPLPPPPKQHLFIRYIRVLYQMLVEKPNSEFCDLIDWLCHIRGALFFGIP